MLLQVDVAGVQKQFPRPCCELGGRAPGFCTDSVQIKLNLNYSTSDTCRP